MHSFNLKYSKVILNKEKVDYYFSYSLLINYSIMKTSLKLFLTIKSGIEFE